MAMYEIGWMDQMVLVALWVGLLYGFYGLALAYLALTDLEWRQLIAERLQGEWLRLKLRLCLAWLNLRDLKQRGCRWLQG